MRIRLLLVLFIFGSIAGCKNNPIASSGTSTTPYAIWIAAVTTTYISDAPTDTGSNFMLQGYSTIQLWDIPGIVSHHEVSYVRFVLPSLPAGSTIDSAYFELYHAATDEDGTTDATQFWVSEVGTGWGADTMTWNNGPDHGKYFQPPSPMVCPLHSVDWCGTTDISSIVHKWFTNPATNTGFRLDLANQKNFYKAFNSNRTFTRTDSTLGLAPRLLLIVRIPDTASLAPLRTFAQLPPDANVRLGTYSRRTNLVIMDSIQAGSDFPSSWNAKKGH